MEYQVDKITKKIKTEKRIKKALQIITLGILGIILFINLSMFYQTSKNPDELPYIGNISVLNIVSESMEPEININDLIVIQKCEESETQKGDIITYKKKDGAIVTHRIVKIEKENGTKVYTTKGDKNQKEDEQKIRHSQVLGKYLFKLEGLGKLALKIRETNGLISIFLIILIFIILKNSNEKKKEKRKKIREKYDIKKRRDEYCQNRKEP